MPRRPTTPYRGPKTTAAANRAPATTAIIPATLEFSVTADRYPRAAARTATPTATSIILGRRSVSICAVAAGTMSIATTRIDPTASNAATVTPATIAIRA